MTEHIYQCSHCGNRLVRSRAIEPNERCPGCGRQGPWLLYRGGSREPRRGHPGWLQRFWQRIEGGRGPIRW